MVQRIMEIVSYFTPKQATDKPKALTRIKRENSTDTVKYGLDSAQMNNPGQFELQKQPSPAGGDQYAEETFKVYYVKDPTRGGALTEGKVKAAATFRMSYQ